VPSDRSGFAEGGESWARIARGKIFRANLTQEAEIFVVERDLSSESKSLCCIDSCEIVLVD
jgi:hypothetical protein